MPTLSVMLSFADQLIQQFGIVLFVVLCIGVASFVIQFIYYSVIYSRVWWQKRPLPITDKQPVSVIICARNAEANLRRFLPIVLEQDYPDYEVVVVNDCSTDDTLLLLMELKEKYPHLYFTNIQPDNKFAHGKKLALTVGIKAAKNEWLLLTDADCMPQSKHWISTMQENFTANTQIVLGYGGYMKEKTLLNSIIRYDTAFAAMQYLTFAQAGMPYMGVGRNLAYRKSLFFANKGFAAHHKLASGDDDLFVNALARRKNTRAEWLPDSFTLSLPKQTWITWVRQKKRHFTTSVRYRWWHKILLSLEVLSRVLFYASVIAIPIINSTMMVPALSAYLVRLLIQTLILYKAFSRLQDIILLAFVPIFDIIFPFLHLYIYMLSLLRKNRYQWN